MNWSIFYMCISHIIIFLPLPEVLLLLKSFDVLFTETFQCIIKLIFCLKAYIYIDLRVLYKKIELDENWTRNELHWLLDVHIIYNNKHNKNLKILFFKYVQVKKNVCIRWTFRFDWSNSVITQYDILKMYLKYKIYLNIPFSRIFM